MKPIILILSCEHAVNHVPKAYEAHFLPFQEVVNSHRGIDFGALAIANYLSDSLGCELISTQTTRLLIDCNRSLHHRHCFSEITRHLTPAEKNLIKQQYYFPFRQEIESLIQSHLQAGKQVWHLSVHSFTPILNGLVRNAEIGLLYDPRRSIERSMAKHWQREIKHRDPGLRVRLNYPYRGISDGFTGALRKKYPSEDYIGIELESNQALVNENHTLAHLACVLSASLKTILNYY